MTSTVIPPGVSRPDLGLLQAKEVVLDERHRADACAAMVDWLRDQQWPSLRHGVPSTDDIRHWVDEPLDLLAASVTNRKARAGIALLRRRLGRELAGASLVLSEVGGEIRLGHWWLTDDIAEIAVVDAWHPSGHGLPELDPLRLVLAASVEAGTDRSVTEGVRRVLRDGWNEDEQIALGQEWITNVGIRPSTLVLLAWLHEASMREPGRAERDLLEGFAPSARRPIVPDERALRVETLPEAREAEPEARVAPAERSVRERSTSAVGTALVRARERAAQRRETRTTLALLVTGVGLWLAGTWGLHPEAMTDLGLLSILRPTAYLGLVVLLAAFAKEVVSPRLRTWRAAAPIVALVALLHGTPAWLYGTLRYSWAWKHLGIIDYIHRNGSVDPTVGALDVYHNWPGFFAVNSALTDLFGLSSAVQYARWWPVAANLASIAVLLFVYGGLRGGDDRRRAWTAVAIFTVSNWIGQDYFSPQSMAFLLYLAIVGVVVRHSEAADQGDRPAARRWAVATVLLAAAAIVTSHQVTPVVLVAALMALRINRRKHVIGILLGVVAMLLLWAATGARVFVTDNLASLFEGFGEPVANADANLVDQTALSHDQVLVSMMGRVVLAGVVLLAAVGVIRELRRRGIDRAAASLAVAPGVLLMANRFGGEIGFRSYLFALPFLAWFAAAALRGGARWRPLQIAAITTATAVLLTGFLFGYYGKDRWYRFTGGEVAASTYVLEHAPADSLLVTISANYPGQFENYDRLTYVPIAEEPADSRGELISDPVDRLGEWLSEGTYRKGYILLTRSQEAESEALGILPHGSVARIRRALEASPRFRLAFVTPDAQVFELVDG